MFSNLGMEPLFEVSDDYVKIVIGKASSGFLTDNKRIINVGKADKMSENGVGKDGRMSGKRSTKVGKTSGKILDAIGNRGTITIPEVANLIG